MPNEEYFKNIYRIRKALDTLEEEFWSLITPTQKQFDRYVAERTELQNELEAAFKA